MSYERDGRQRGREEIDRDRIFSFGNEERKSDVVKSTVYIS